MKDIRLYENIINKAWLNKIKEEILEAYDNKILQYEGNDMHYKNSYGIQRMPEGEKLLDFFTPIIEEDYGSVAKENSYSRIYFNGSTLIKHLDRSGLDVTLSLCIYSDINKPWPLFVDDGHNTQEIHTPPGTAGVILGTKHMHWRDELICEENQKVMQVFCHWRLT